MAVSREHAQELMDRLREITWHGAAARRRLRDPLLGNVAGYGPPLLVVMRRLGPVRLTELAEALQVDLSVASRHIGALVEAGYVERRPDPSDGRATQVLVTEQGLAALRATRDRQTQWLQDLLADWEDERAGLAAEVLAELLDRMTDPDALTRPEARKERP